MCSFDNAVNCCPNPLNSGNIPLLQSKTNSIYAIDILVGPVDYRPVLNAITGNSANVYSQNPNNFTQIAYRIARWDV